MFEFEEAVARFFPRSTYYDRKEAKRFIGWLDRCGYVIVRKDELEHRIEARSLSPNAAIVEDPPGRLTTASDASLDAPLPPERFAGP